LAITIRQIEAFRAVVDAGTIVKAARCLEISQPAVSRLISDLEAEIGLKLFKRGHGRLARTAEGESLYDVVRRAFVGLEQIESAAQSISGGQTGHLRIVAMQNIADRFLLDVLCAFSKEHPEVFVTLEICSQMQVLDLLASQQFDIGFIMHPCTSSAFRVEKFLVEDAVCILPEDHPLAQRTIILSEDLKKENFIDFPRATEFRMRIDDVFANAGVERRAKMEARTNRAICRLVANGLGVSIIALSDPGNPMQQGIAVRPFSPAIPIEVNMVFPAGRFVSNLTERFADFACDFRDRFVKKKK
jgi:DNA-binding transcriptional LysR family regulator